MAISTASGSGDSARLAVRSTRSTTSQVAPVASGSQDVKGKGKTVNSEGKKSKRVTIKSELNHVKLDAVAKATIAATAPKLKGKAGASKKKVGANRRQKELIPGEPDWKLVRPQPRVHVASDTNRPPTALKPRIWSTSRRELTTIIPELSDAKSAHGVSWAMSETPVILMDEGEVDVHFREESTSVDVTMVRDFSCFPSDMQSFSALPKASRAPVLPQFGRHVVPTTDMLKPSANMLFHPLNRETAYLPPASRGTRSPPPTLYPPTTPSFSRIDPVDVALPPVQTTNASTGATLPSFVELTAGLDTLPSSDPPPCRCTRVRFNRDCLHGEDDITPSFRATRVAKPIIPYYTPPAPDNSSDTSVNLVEHIKSSINNGDTNVQLPINVTTPPHPIAVPIYPGTLAKLGSRFEKPDIEIPLDQRVPSKLPPELQVLVDAYVQGAPVILIASRAIMTDVLRVPEEVAFMYLGLFVIEAVEERRIMCPNDPPSIASVHGRVEWRFTFKWSSGGEMFLPTHLHEQVSRPWWISKETYLAMPRTDDITLDRKSSSRYDLQRKAYQASRSQKADDFNIMQSSLIPLRLLAPHGENDSDETFTSSGWHCSVCGKLNEQLMMRHRKCSSPACASDTNVEEGYALSLESVRDPQQALFAALPYDIYPPYIDPSLVIWKDGMRTLTYLPNENPGVFVKHVFTCNRSQLQEEPTVLFYDFQKTVCLQRKNGDEPYFTYSVGSNWDGVPACVLQARDFLEHRGRWYGENEHCKINRMTALAWVTSGSKRGSDCISAKRNDVVILCLGHDTELTIIPKSGFRSIEDPIAMDESVMDGLLPLDQDDPMDGSFLKGENDAFIEAPPEMMDETATTVVEETSSTVRRRPGAKKKQTILFTLVHGDIILLSGDDYDYSIKRSGTSILLIGSYIAEK